MELVVAFSALFLMQAQLILGAHDLSETYRFSATLDGNGQYQLHWNYDLDAGTISFAARVNTRGWVGFGVSPTGRMPGSDVVIGWVDGEGKVFFHDRFAEGYFLPPIDGSQDWELIGGEEEGGFTILEFTRNLTSCDERDLDIQADTSRVVWSLHSEDPANLDSILFHESMGSTSLNLLGGLNEDRPAPPDTDSFIIRNENLTLPHDSDTTYWCSAFRLPPEVRERERYVFKASPSISEESFAFVHHILVYTCNFLDNMEVGSSTVCDSASINVDQCRGETLIGGWAVGGAGLLYPKDVALPVGGPGSHEFVVLEIHYDNADLVQGVVDSSGIEFFYTNTEPVNRAGILTLGHRVTSHMIIPPNADNFVVTGVCHGACTESFFPAEGINVFANLLHTHLAGHGLVLKHLEGNEECDVLEEVEPIDSNLRYDFNYQQFTILPREVKILPGDTLNLECFYRTSTLDSVTLGGESTHDEMCFSFLAYYPQTDLTFCASTTVPNAYVPFASQYVEESNTGLLFQSLATEDEEGISAVLNQVGWTPEAVQSLQDSVSNSDVVNFCISGISDDPRNLVFSAQLPTVDCPYQAPDACTGFEPLPCCERLDADMSSAPLSVTVSNFLCISLAIICILVGSA